MVIVGLDPSFTNTGIAIIDSSRKVIKFASFGSPIGGNSFVNLMNAVKSRTEGIIGIITDYGAPDYIISETPPPQGSFGSGLFGLDVHLLLTLKAEYGVKIYGVAPTYVGHLHHTRKYNKSQSVALAKQLLTSFTKHGYTQSLSGRLSADMSEAFLFAVRMFVLYGDKATVKSLLEVEPNFNNAKEFEL